jgi:hypothetical protein
MKQRGQRMKKGKADATMRNVKASHNRDNALHDLIARLMRRVERIEKLLAMKALKK